MLLPTRSWIWLPHLCNSQRCQRSRSVSRPTRRHLHLRSARQISPTSSSVQRRSARRSSWAEVDPSRQEFRRNAAGLQWSERSACKRLIFCFVKRSSRTSLRLMRNADRLLRSAAINSASISPRSRRLQRSRHIFARAPLRSSSRRLTQNFRRPHSTVKVSLRKSSQSLNIQPRKRSPLLGTCTWLMRTKLSRRLLSSHLALLSTRRWCKLVRSESLLLED